MIKPLHNVFRAINVYLQQRLSPRQFFILSSVIVGLSSGLAAILLKYLVHTIESAVDAYGKNHHNFSAVAWFPFLGILLAVLFVHFVLKGNFKKGTAEIALAIAKKSSIIPTAQMYTHFVTSLLTVGFGGSTGLESPMVSTGSAIGSNYGRIYNLSYKEKTIMLACGAAAGISAAFNSPIAGVLFAIEVLLTDISATAFIPLIISSACGALLSRIIMEEGVIISFSLQQPFDYKNVPFYIILGILAGLVSLYYARVFTWIEKKMKLVASPWLRVAIGGTCLLGLLIIFPPLFGEGYNTITELARLKPEGLTNSSALSGYLDSDAALLMFLSALMLFKVVAAAITIGSGGNGGSFGPSLFTGAYLGFIFARLVNLSGIAVIPEVNFTLVAMAGLLSGVLYAPLTGIFLIAEITGGYALMIPLMIVSAISITVAHFAEPLSMEARKLSALLKQPVDDRDKFLLSKLNLQELIEDAFSIIKPTDTLDVLVKTIAISRRNIFPVVNEHKELVGVIHLDNVRNVIFNPELYATLKVSDMMKVPAAIISTQDHLHDILKKFDETNEWNLPVAEGKIYKGFVSKSSILSRYRKEILMSV
jgi:chloride channel protein, CIC family